MKLSMQWDKDVKEKEREKYQSRTKQVVQNYADARWDEEQRRLGKGYHRGHQPKER